MNADELREAMRALPEPVTAREPPYWEYWRWELWTRVCAGAETSEFMGWPCIYHTMLVNHWKEPVGMEFKAISDDKRLLDAVRIAPVGVPADFHELTGYSRNLIHQAYHLHRWEQITGQRIEDLGCIVEFGAGYGAMALVARRAGFSGEYRIIDLPEFVLLQQWFLSQCGVGNVVWVDGWEQNTCDLLIAMYSLSETPLDVRGQVFEAVGADSYLFLYSQRWQEYDNHDYFRSLELRDEQWHFEEIAHLPDRGNWYAMMW